MCYDSSKCPRSSLMQSILNQMNQMELRFQAKTNYLTKDRDLEHARIMEDKVEKEYTQAAPMKLPYRRWSGS